MSDDVVLNLWKQRLGRVPDHAWDRVEIETPIIDCRRCQTRSRA